MKQNVFGGIYQLYWFIRYYSRNKSIKRKYYRYVAKEKKRLVEQLGVDPEELRLLCKYLSSRSNLHAERNLRAYRKNQISSRSAF